MNRNLFRMDMKRNAANLITWIGVITILISVTMAVYPAFLANQSKIMGMLTIIPKGALQFKGISNFTDLLSAVGFYAANNVMYMMVLGSIFSIVLASNIILKEEYQKTAEFLFTWPLTRGEIFTGKMLVLLINILLLNLITSAAGYISIKIVNPGTFNFRAFLTLSVYTFLLNLFFGALGMLLSTLVKKPRPITTFSIGLVLILYFIETISKITEGISSIGYLSPFRYAPVNAAADSFRLEPLNVSYFIVLSVLFSVIAWAKFKRKDIYL